MTIDKISTCDDTEIRGYSLYCSVSSAKESSREESSYYSRRRFYRSDQGPRVMKNHNGTPDGMVRISQPAARFRKQKEIQVAQLAVAIAESHLIESSAYSTAASSTL